MLEQLFDFLFGWAFNFGEPWALIIIAVMITLLSTLAQKFFSNQKEMKRLKMEMNELRKEMKAVRKDPDKMMKINEKSMKKNMEYMKHSFRPLLITLIPILLVFGYLSGHYIAMCTYDEVKLKEFCPQLNHSDTVNKTVKLLQPTCDNITKVPTECPKVFFFGWNWIWTYIIVSIIVSLGLRKVLDIH